MSLTCLLATFYTDFKGGVSMLKAKAEIKFTLQGQNYVGGKHFRPVFRFADGLLFSGTVVSENAEYVYDRPYLVDLEFFTIDDEAFAAIQPIISTGMGLTIQAGARIIGIATLLEFTYAAKITA